MGSLHAIDFGVFWTEGGSMFRYVSMGSEVPKVVPGFEGFGVPGFDGF